MRSPASPGSSARVGTVIRSVWVIRSIRAMRGRLGSLATDERGSAVAEFAMVGALLTILTLAVMQLALALHVRNTALDAASEGARFAALADGGLADGVARTTDLITTAIGPGFAADVSASFDDYRGIPAATITVRTPLPVIGLIGFEGAMEVTGHAAIESLD